MGLQNRTDVLSGKWERIQNVHIAFERGKRRRIDNNRFLTVLLYKSFCTIRVDVIKGDLCHFDKEKSSISGFIRLFFEFGILLLPCKFSELNGITALFNFVKALEDEQLRLILQVNLQFFRVYKPCRGRL